MIATGGQKDARRVGRARECRAPYKIGRDVRAMMLRRLDMVRRRSLHPGSMFWRLLGVAALVTSLTGLAWVIAWPGAADGNAAWVEVRSAHFTVECNAGEKQARR